MDPIELIRFLQAVLDVFFAEFILVLNLLHFFHPNMFVFFLTKNAAAVCLSKILNYFNYILLLISKYAKYGFFVTDTYLYLIYSL